MLQRFYAGVILIKERSLQRSLLELTQQNFLSTSALSSSLQSVLSLAQGRKGAVVLYGFFWIMLMDFRATSMLQGRLRTWKSHYKVNF